MTYTVRPAVPADLAGVVRVLARATAEVAVSDHQEAMWARMLATDDLTVFVAAADHGEVVGTTSLLVLPNLTYDCRPTAFFEPMVVAAEHRRRGVGRLLVEAVLAGARAAGCWKVQVVSHVRHTDDGAYDFYRALGFEGEATGFRRYLE
ncbi:MAG TPA: GNAT family N-acetyltransferase [Acidimicrobiales bacterium]|nr:GNAT family N-acetyltransferase [Acidimicrobiales bacterium]